MRHKIGCLLFLGGLTNGVSAELALLDVSAICWRLCDEVSFDALLGPGRRFVVSALRKITNPATASATASRLRCPPDLTAPPGPAASRSETSHGQAGRQQRPVPRRAARTEGTNRSAPRGEEEQRHSLAGPCAGSAASGLSVKFQSVVRDSSQRVPSPERVPGPQAGPSKAPPLQKTTTTPPQQLQRRALTPATGRRRQMLPADPGQTPLAGCEAENPPPR